eukprot:gene21676-28694_t
MQPRCVLNDFATKLGIDTAQYAFCDIFGLDSDLLCMVPTPVLAVIKCNLITPNTEAATKKEDDEQASSGVAASCPAYYMKQTIGNACGTIAVLHGLDNNRDTMKPAAGSFLDQFFTATAGLDPSACGAYLEHPPEGAPSIL